MSYQMRDRIAAIIQQKKLIHEPIAVARMILQEMLEPTPEMVEAAHTAHMSQEDARDVWRAMIECALRDRRPAQ